MIVMKNEILDTPIVDTFDSFLEKGEKILWTDSSIEIKDSFYNKNPDGTTSFRFVKFLVSTLDTGIKFLIGASIGLTYLAFHWFLEPEKWKTYASILVFIIFMLSLIHI